MSEPRARRVPNLVTAEVRRTERLTPHLVRVVLGGPGLDGFALGGFTDHYIKLQFPLPGVDYPEPFDLARVREEMPREQWPVTRTYTVRRWDAAAREMWVDFVVHGDRGVAAPWAVNAKPGDLLRFAGPGGAYAPAPEAEWHLLVGDESALPAIASSLERFPAGACGRAFVEVAGTEEEQELETPAAVELTWVHRGGARVGERLLEAVRGLDLNGDVQAFVHGEAGFVKELRRLLVRERGLARSRTSISGYWRLGHDEDSWQATKREFDRPD